MVRGAVIVFEHILVYLVGWTHCPLATHLITANREIVKNRSSPGGGPSLFSLTIISFPLSFRCTYLPDYRLEGVLRIARAVTNFLLNGIFLDPTRRLLSRQCLKR